jgi:hypothetical protein
MTRREMLKRVLLENMKERDNLKYLAVDGRIIFKCILKKLDLRGWNGFLMLMIGTSGRLL